jgi:hypothetical protein
MPRSRLLPVCAGSGLCGSVGRSGQVAAGLGVVTAPRVLVKGLVGLQILCFAAKYQPKAYLQGCIMGSSSSVKANAGKLPASTSLSLSFFCTLLKLIFGSDLIISIQVTFHLANLSEYPGVTYLVHEVLWCLP